MNRIHPNALFPIALAVCVAIGVATDNLALWICIGIADGVILRTSAARRPGGR